MAGRAALFLVLCLACGAGDAAPQDESVQSVQVNGQKDPEMHSYRAVVAGLNAFDKHHGLAPAVPEARFRVIDHRAQPSISLDGLELRIASDDASIPVPITPDGRFVVPRNEAAYDAKADLVFNRKRSSYQVVPDLRTPGFPENVRRLGDLRLECKIQVAIGKEEMPLWATMGINTLLLTSDWCSKLTPKGGGYATPSPRRLASATLSEGTRSETLKAREWYYIAPIGDASWSDEARVELTYAEE